MRHLELATCILVWASISHAQTAVTSDPLAIRLAQQTFTTLASGVQVNDVVINANVTSPLGDGTDTGTATFSAKGLLQSRVDLSLGTGNRSEVRAAAGRGAWTGTDGKATAFAGHNCQTDAAWFFPALSSLAQTSNPGFVFTYIGDEQYGTVGTHHIRVYRTGTVAEGNLTARMSAEDFYLDTQTGLPVAVAFKVHPDFDLLTDLGVEIRFGNYQKVSGVLIPFSFQRVVNGAVVLDVAVTNAVVNSGTPDSEFNVQ